MKEWKEQNLQKMREYDLTFEVACLKKDSLALCPAGLVVLGTPMSLFGLLASQPADAHRSNRCLDSMDLLSCFLVC